MAEYCDCARFVNLDDNVLHKHELINGGINIMNYKCDDNCENVIVLVITELSNVVKCLEMLLNRWNKYDRNPISGQKYL